MNPEARLKTPIATPTPDVTAVLELLGRIGLLTAGQSHPGTAPPDRAALLELLGRADPLDVNQRYTIPQAAKYLKISRAYVYRLIEKGEIKTLVDGRRRFISGSEIAKRSALPSAQ